MFKSALQAAYQNGGDASIAACPRPKIQASAFANVQRTNEVGSKQPAVVNAAFTSTSDFGVVKIIPNRVMAAATAGLNDTVYIIDADKLAGGVLRPFESERLATVGDARTGRCARESC